MVSRVIRSNIVNLQRIVNSSPKDARKILRHASGHLITAIRECVINVLNGIVHLKPEQLEKIRKFKAKLRKIRDKKIGKAEQKKIIQTGGNFLIPLITAVLPHVIGGIASLVKNKKRIN